MDSWRFNGVLMEGSWDGVKVHDIPCNDGYSLRLNMTIDIVSFPSLNGGSFQFVMSMFTRGYLSNHFSVMSLH